MSDERKLLVARALFDYDHGGFNDGPMWEDDEGARLHYLGAADAAIAALRGVEAVAVRYDGDGYGYRYIDNGSGSDWLTRHKDGEPLYALPAPPSKEG